MNTIVVGIAGGTGSGKTLVAQMIKKHLKERIALMGLDNYYKDYRTLTADKRAAINYDHPDAFDIPLFLEQLDNLKRN